MMKMSKLFRVSLSKPDLWAKIEAFQFSDFPDGTNFVSKVAQVTGMRDDDTDQAIFEYRRFIYLSVVSLEKMVPSETVAEVWRIHLSQTEEYLGYFCPEILGKELPYSTPPGFLSRRQSYFKTLTLYEAEFGCSAPQAHWPQRFDGFFATIAGLGSFGLFWLAVEVNGAYILGLFVSIPLLIKFSSPIPLDG